MSRLKLLACSLSAALILLAQTQTPGPHGVDGSKTPDLIPDDVAYRFVLLSLIVPDNPTQLDLFKHNARLKRLAMDSANKQRIEGVLVAFAREYTAWQSSISSVPTTNLAELQHLQIERDALVSKYESLISSQLSRESALIFKQYVTSQKTKMVY
jgi:hypothetical protein